jgi:diguanylate cyclase (GGDEF)-like protein
MSLPRPPLASSLSTQVTLYLAVALALAFGVLGWINVQNDSARAEAELKAAARGRSAIMALSLAPMLAGYNYTTVELVASAVAQQAGIVRIEVANARGKTVAAASGMSPSAGTIAESRDVLFNGEKVGAIRLELSTDALAARKADILFETARTGILSFVLLWLALRALLAWKVLTPVRHLREMVLLIASKPEHLSREDLPYASKDEVGELVHVFNDMKRKLGDAYDKLADKVSLADSALQQANVELHERASQLENALEKLETLSITDSLTRVFNRRGFENVLQRGLAEAIRYDQPASLLLVDLDHFKAINDSHGHIAGDRALVAVGAALRDGVRNCDTAGRLGGDEFAVFLPNTGAAEAELLCQRLFQRANAVKVAHEHGTTPLSVSFGLATTTSEPLSAERLIGNADLALYEAKRRGRGAWTAFAPDTPAIDYRGGRRDG